MPGTQETWVQIPVPPGSLYDLGKASRAGLIKIFSRLKVQMAAMGARYPAPLGAYLFRCLDNFAILILCISVLSSSSAQGDKSTALPGRGVSG